MAQFEQGTVLEGRYEVLKVLGEGGMATVYQVRHTGLQSIHALKVLNPEFQANVEVRARFLSEGRIQAKLRHPNVVQVTEIVTTPVAGLIMDYVEGPTLADHLRRGGAIRDVAVLRELFLPVLDALGEAHAQGIVHRDLKPENILLGRDSRGRLQPRVADFGIARLMDGGGVRQTRAGSKLGTVHYMSPEQIRGADEADARSDIFSLGAILYEMATGQVAFHAQSEFDTQRAIVDGKYTPPERIVAGMDPLVSGAISVALSTDPGKRFPSCAVFAQVLGGDAGLLPARPQARSLQAAPVAPVVRPPPVASVVTQPASAPPGDVRLEPAGDLVTFCVLTVLTLGIYPLYKFYDVGTSYDRLSGGRDFSSRFWGYFAWCIVGGVCSSFLPVISMVPALVSGYRLLGYALAQRDVAAQRYLGEVPATFKGHSEHRNMWMAASVLSLVCVGFLMAAVQAGWFFGEYNEMARRLRRA